MSRMRKWPLTVNHAQPTCIHLSALTMGKVRAKDRNRRGRPRPTGLPSVRETIQQGRLEPTGSQRAAILDQVGCGTPVYMPSLYQDMTYNLTT